MSVSGDYFIFDQMQMLLVLLAPVIIIATYWLHKHKRCTVRILIFPFLECRMSSSLNAQSPNSIEPRHTFNLKLICWVLLHQVEEFKQFNCLFEKKLFSYIFFCLLLRLRCCSSSHRKHEASIPFCSWIIFEGEKKLILMRCAHGQSEI